MSDWYERFAEVSKTTPEGVLLGFNDEEAVLHIEQNEGAPPFIYGRAFIPELVDTDPKWVLQTENMMSYHGWKCVLMPRARTELLKVATVMDNKIKVKGLKVIRPSQTGKSLLCEVVS